MVFLTNQKIKIKIDKLFKKYINNIKNIKI
uniref:Uncharacterized protein n=1 Tax=viral metagenome TaxID=1070528 RepID=A0A6C0AZV2_9ZZZZ